MQKRHCRLQKSVMPFRFIQIILLANRLKHTINAFLRLLSNRFFSSKKPSKIKGSRLYDLFPLCDVGLSPIVFGWFSVLILSILSIISRFVDFFNSSCSHFCPTLLSPDRNLHHGGQVLVYLPPMCCGTGSPFPDPILQKHGDPRFPSGLIIQYSHSLQCGIGASAGCWRLLGNS